MILGREIDHPWFDQATPEIRFTKPHVAGLAASLIVGEHLRESPFELQRDPLAHHSNGVNGVNQRLCAGLEQVTLSHVLDHGLPLKNSHGLTLIAKDRPPR
jgi:hypothetical protein